MNGPGPCSVGSLLSFCIIDLSVVQWAGLGCGQAAYGPPMFLRFPACYCDGSFSFLWVQQLCWSTLGISFMYSVSLMGITNCRYSKIYTMKSKVLLKRQFISFKIPCLCRNQWSVKVLPLKTMHVFEYHDGRHVFCLNRFRCAYMDGNNENEED